MSTVKKDDLPAGWEDQEDQAWRPLGGPCRTCNQLKVQFRVAKYEPPLTIIEYRCLDCLACWTTASDHLSKWRPL